MTDLNTHNHSAKAKPKGYATYANAERKLNRVIEASGITNVRCCVVALENGRFLPAVLGTGGGFFVGQDIYWMG